MIPAYLTGAYHLWIPGLIYLCLIVIIERVKKSL